MRRLCALLASSPMRQRMMLSGRWIARTSLLALGLAHVACGGSDNTDRTLAAGGGPAGTLLNGSGGTGGSSTSCSPQLADGWMPPAWLPPKMPVSGACTLQQVDGEYAACVDPAATDTTCAAFQVQANSACVSCILNAGPGASRAPILLDSNNRWSANVSGCVALIDGDLSDQGCGAKTKASEDCAIDSCAGCWNATLEASNACEDAAFDSVACVPFRLAAACGNPTKYARCYQSVAEDRFKFYAQQFCVQDTLSSSGAGNEAGAPAQ